jgi:DMSO/TMAO reductase YedYZ molybdopterin-dependent catalytic subunit
MAENPDPRPYGRRAFLGVVAGGLSALFWAEPVWHQARGALRTAASILPSELAEIVPTQGWRIYTVAATMPTFDPTSWRLRIGGLVERPLTLSYEDLRALPSAGQVSDFHCVTGWSVENVHWRGVRFRDLLAAARPLPEAQALTFVSAEKPYRDSLLLEQALLPDAMLGYDMDGQPLTRAHGAPARVVIPEMYGYKNVKWVNRIEVTAKPVEGYWELLGYDRDAWVGRSNGYG